MKEFYTTTEFAKLLNVHPRTIVKLIKINKIKAINVSTGKKPVYRIYQHEVERFMAEEYEK